MVLTEVPDYTWYAGCYGTASGNLMGYWDRHGFPDFYTGPTAGGVAPLSSAGVHSGIRSMWASKAGFDGRPDNQFGHIDNYWLFYSDDGGMSYESTEPDPYRLAGRPEHAADCIGDFIGLSQNKWTNLNGECDGNVDGFSFIFWDATGARRWNFVPPQENGRPVADVPSGLRAWTHFRGSDAHVFSQLTDFNPTVQAGEGFTFGDLMAEIDAGYPVLLHLQNFEHFSRPLGGMARANPEIHALLAHGYYVNDAGEEYVRYKTSWGSSGENTLSQWNAQTWQAGLPVRGVIGYRPLPQITAISQGSGALTIEWDGPSSVLSNMVTRTSAPIHHYVVERSTSLSPADFQPISDPSIQLSFTFANCCPEESAFFRVRLMPAAYARQE